MLKSILSAVMIALLSSASHHSFSQTVISDTIISGLYQFEGLYHISGEVLFDENSELHFSESSEFIIEDSTYLSIFGELSYASDYDSVTIKGLTTDLTSVEIHFFGQNTDSIELRNWRIGDILLRPQVQYPDSLAVLNFHDYKYLAFDNVDIENCGVVQVDDNVLTRTFGALMMDNASKISINNSILKKCQSSSTGGALTICNSDSIFLSHMRFYENIGIDSASAGNRILYSGQGSSCSVDISNKYLEVNSGVFAFDTNSVTATYLSANTTVVDNCIFYASGNIGLLSQASVSNMITIRSSSFIECNKGVAGGPNIIMEDCIFKNAFRPNFIQKYGYAMNYSIAVPRFESKNVYYFSESDCIDCGNGFISYDNFEDVLDTLSVSQIDGYSIFGIFPSVEGLLIDQSSKPCSSTELDILSQSRCVGSAPDIGAVELQQTVSVAEINEGEIFSLYPNPTSDQLFVESISDWDALSASLIDLTGRVHALSIENVSGNLKLLRIPEGLSPGIYVVMLTDEDGLRRIGKVLVKQNW